MTQGIQQGKTVIVWQAEIQQDQVMGNPRSGAQVVPQGSATVKRPNMGLGVQRLDFALHSP
jgi:hypothetical protein